MLSILTLLMNPKRLMYTVGIILLIGGIFWGIRSFNTYIDDVKASVVQECNDIKLQEELEFEKRKNAELEQRAVLLQNIIDEMNKEDNVRIEYRDRVITKIKEVQSEVEKTDEGKLREEISPTSIEFMKELMDNSK